MQKVPVAYDFPWTAPGQQNWEQVRAAFARIGGSINNPQNGPTGARPTAQRSIGDSYFDTTLGYTVWWNGAHWVNASGVVV